MNKEYLHGTRYYYSAECFLYFATRFIQNCNSPDLQNLWIPILRVHLIELRVGSMKSADPLATAMRIIISIELGLLPSSADIVRLLDSQGEDGGWYGGWFYKYGSSGILIENVGLTSTLALKALTSF